MDAESRARYQKWLDRADDAAIREQLKQLSGNPAELEDCFSEGLRFGTGGVRAKMGAGPNRMNAYVVARITQGYCNCLSARCANPSVAVAYDTRAHSEEFAARCAQVFAANRIQVHLFAEPTPTPVLSFAVRALACDGGVVITASHNPAAYNGYKIYGADGVQIDPQAAAEIQAQIQRTDPFDDVQIFSREEALASGMLRPVPDRIKGEFLRSVSEQSRLSCSTPRDFPIVYTPLNGTGAAYVPQCLLEHGYAGLSIVPEQAYPDGSFSTCPRPDPQSAAALQRALRLAEEQNAYLVLATDPDCDRLGVAARDGKELKHLTGNEIGLLLADYLLTARQEAGDLPARPVLVRTIVTSELVDRIAARFHAQVGRVLTGFKFIGEEIGRMERQGELDRFVLGLEESCGYLSGGYVRDKDGVGAALLVCDMAAWHRAAGRTLPQALELLYQSVGRREERLLNWQFPGAQGSRVMNDLMHAFRETRMRGETTRTDYLLDSETGLPKSDVLQIRFSDGASAVLRPSGTEPDLKLYLSADGADASACRTRLDDLTNVFSGGVGMPPSKAY